MIAKFETIRGDYKKTQNIQLK